MPRRELPAYLPIWLDEGVEGDRFLAAWGSAGMTTSLGMAGKIVSTGEPVVYLACDVAEQLRPPRDKVDQEKDDVGSCLDTLLAESVVSVRSLEAGPHPNDPPDVVATLSDGRRLGCETFQLHLPATVAGRNDRPLARRARFEKLRGEIMRRSGSLGGKLRRHRRTVVYVWFGSSATPVSSEVPTGAADADLLIQHLTSSSPPSVAPAVATRFEPFPANAAPNAVAWNSDQTLGVTWSSLPSAYDSTFVTALGFELALVHGQSVRLTDAVGELRRLVEQHDWAQNDVLVVSTNSTTRGGLYSASSKFLADLIFEADKPLGEWAPTNLRHVVLHDPSQPSRARWIVGEALP